jgi:glycogen operon protein
MKSRTVTPGCPEPLGASLDAAGVNFAVLSAHAESVAVSLFDAADHEIDRIPLPGRTGDVFHGHIAGLGAGTRYGLRAQGPSDPDRGHRFNPAKLLVDPWATRLDRAFRLAAALCDTDGPKADDTAPLVPKAVVEADVPVAATPPRFDWTRGIIYELHVRGFTAQHPDIPEAQRGTFAGLAHPAALDHLRRLGVTAVELMPCAAWIDDRHLLALGVSNYWGYNPAAFLAPDPRLAPGGWAEIAAAVAALHDAGMAVLLDVVLNHSGEGDELGPTVSLRGLDNVTYYRTAGAGFVNDAGCGNILALDRPAPLRLAMDALRTWALRAGLDGFRLDLATTLGRRPDGFDPGAPLLAAMQQDPVLSRCAIIAEPWDVGPGGYQLGRFPAGWGEWNDRFRDTVRRFWRGDAGMLGDFATRLAGSADVFAARHRPLTRSINFVTAHDGFTLADLVAYTDRRNHANGEGNRDGTDENHSWNHGHEGPTDDPAVLAARAQDVRALLATLVFARGTPMLSMGDEAGRTQHGNNNAYAQDNPTAWFDWAGLDPALTDFTARLLRTRLTHPLLCEGRPLTGHPVDDTLIPDVVWHRPDGAAMQPDDWNRPDNRSVVVALYGGGERLVLVIHAGAEPIGIALPEPRSGRRWHCTIDSADPDHDAAAADPFPVAGRSVVLLTEADGEPPRRRTGVPSDQLERLAQAAGIAPVWWDIDGTEHRVGDDTKQALLAAMRLPAATTEDVRAGLAWLTLPRPGGLPAAWVGRAGQPVRVTLAATTARGWAWLRQEDGATTQIPVAPGSTEVALGPLPLGYHRLWLDAFPDSACHLIVVPERCYLPAALVERRRFGLAAQLYTLRRPGDQGIGDFTTLATLVETGAACGAAAIGLNPLHALFPGDRDRASPYYPSDRRFLDPIYLDVPGLQPIDGDTIDYPAVWTAKQAALRQAFAAAPAEDAAFTAFLAAGGAELRQFATFEAIAADQASSHWQRWPEALRHPANPAVAAFAADHEAAVRFSCWLQYQAEGQFSAAARRAALPVGLYRDMAVGSAPDGAEAWSRQDALLSGVSVGAPPDPFSAQGQVWGLPAPDPLAMAREGYAGFAALLAANMRHAGALRIDHAMGLQRLFLVPPGASAQDGTYLGYPFPDLLGVLALESQRAQCLIVGETLGTVPEGMTQALAAADVLSYSVLWFERDGPALRRPAAWPARGAACVSTHDLPTLAGWWQGADIIERRALGLLDDVGEGRALQDRQSDKAALLALLAEEGLLPEPVDPNAPLPVAFVAAVHAFIASTPAMLALVQADDLAGEVTAVNLPGTDRERPNWRRRLGPDTADLVRSELAQRVLAAMHAGGRV